MVSIYQLSMAKYTGNDVLTILTPYLSYYRYRWCWNYEHDEKKFKHSCFSFFIYVVVSTQSLIDKIIRESHKDKFKEH